MKTAPSPEPKAAQSGGVSVPLFAPVGFNVSRAVAPGSFPAVWKPLPILCTLHSKWEDATAGQVTLRNSISGCVVGESARDRDSRGIMIDIHTHILPGIDDGAADLTAALDLCRSFASQGGKAVVATPHQTLDGDGPVTSGSVRRLCQLLEDALRSEGVGLRLHPGAEIYVEADTSPDDICGKGIPIGNVGRYVLLEFSWHSFQWFDETAGVLAEVQRRGYVPIIAHPERYGHFIRRAHVLEELVSSGMVLQVTAGALTGRQGRRVQRCAMRWLEAGLVQILASDVHEPGSVANDLREAREFLKQTYCTQLAVLLTETNPRNVIAGTDLQVPTRQMLCSRLSWLGRLFGRKNQDGGDGSVL